MTLDPLSNTLKIRRGPSCAACLMFDAATYCCGRRPASNSRQNASVVHTGGARSPSAQCTVLCLRSSVAEPRQCRSFTFWRYCPDPSHSGGIAPDPSLSNCCLVQPRNGGAHNICYGAGRCTTQTESHTASTHKQHRCSLVLSGSVKGSGVWCQRVSDMARRAHGERSGTGAAASAQRRPRRYGASMGCACRHPDSHAGEDILLTRKIHP